MMTGQDFIMNDKVFMMTGCDFFDDRSKLFWLLLQLKSQTARTASHQPAFMGNCPTISYTC